MKVTLDLDKLLEDGEIDQAEYEKLSQLSAGGTTALAFNILVGFGAIAVSGASLALLPDATTSIVLGLVVVGVGVGLVYARSEHWRMLANICVLVGALLFGGGVVFLGEGSISSLLTVAAVFGAIHFYTQWFERLGATAESVLLAGVIALAIAVGLRAVNNALREEAGAHQAGGHPPA